MHLFVVALLLCPTAVLLIPAAVQAQSMVVAPVGAPVVAPMGNPVPAPVPMQSTIPGPVPLAGPDPYVPAPSVRDDLVNMLDLSATTLVWAGVEIPDWYEGQDLFADERSRQRHHGVQEGRR